MRQIVLDTETTGLEWTQDHRIIEIGCVELVNRRFTGKHYHQYLNPEREIDAGAQEVHGITNEYLSDKPTFATVADEFLTYIQDAELIIHNAAFDVGFINYEFNRLNRGEDTIAKHCRVIDTLGLARQLHPGQRNSLDALCKRYGVDNSQRTLHGALLDAEILADVYLLMTGGQTELGFEQAEMASHQVGATESGFRTVRDKPQLKVLEASCEELAAHRSKLDELSKKSGQTLDW